MVIIGIVDVVGGGEVEMIQDAGMRIEIKCCRLRHLFLGLLLLLLLLLLRLIFLAALQDGRHCVMSNAHQRSIRYNGR